MSAIELRPTTRGDRLRAARKHAGSDCRQALNRYREKERWGYQPVRPVERIDVRTAYDHLDVIEEWDDSADNGSHADTDFRKYLKHQTGPASFERKVGRMVNGCFIGR